ncbi:hypothetical protein [Lysinibacillus sp. LZ02]|uniref:hypothetical protein n=1 Tax=Lysinibacillus sp. LZ02 TaxID=3420668 RepID=UPI003D35C4EB
MQYRVTLHNGQGFNIIVSGENASEELTKNLNSRETIFINLGGCIVQKNTVATVLPVEQTTESAQ